jgi:hypothetical protein
MLRIGGTQPAAGAGDDDRLAIQKTQLSLHALSRLSKMNMHSQADASFVRTIRRFDIAATCGFWDS